MNPATRETDGAQIEGSGDVPDETHEVPVTPQQGHCDTFPADTRHIATPPGLPFDSPDVRPQLPPGASQANAPLNHYASAASQSPLSHIHPRSPPKSKRPPQKFSILRKKGRGNSNPSSSTPQAQSPTTPDEDDDDEWLLEGTSSNGHVNATVSVGREASNLSRSVDTLSLADSDTGEPARNNNLGHAQAANAPPRTNSNGGEKKLSKTRSLAKKTSRLFGRNNGHGHGHHQHEESSSGASLSLPGASTVRQNSISSHGSNDSRQKHWSLSRVNSTKGSPPPRGTPDSLSQPSSWHPPPAFALRRTTSQTTDTDAGSVIAAPVPIPQLRNRESNSHLSASVPTLRNDSSTSVHSSNNHHHHHQHPQSPSHAQKQDNNAPSRMSSWFTNLLPANTVTGTEQSPPALNESTTLPPSPMRKPPSVAASIFSAARNKAVGGMRYLLDSEATPDHCQDTMWVMGVPHPGYTPEHTYEESSPTASPPSWTTRFKEGSRTSSSSPPTRTGGFSHFFGSSFNIAGQAAEPATPPSDNRSKKDKQKEVPKWPEQFYDDFRSRVWCTYRSQYAPILPLAPGQLLPTPDSYYGAFIGSSTSEGGALPQPGQTSMGSQPSRLSNGPWGWVKGDDRGLTSDAGWGCMLRTGQSLLANALIHLHLGRGWRLPSNKPGASPESPLELAELEAYATYVRILSWFFDDPSPLCPFSVHRMALIGKELGKEVGEWFGPSTAAGALKTLVNSFPLCGLGVVNAVDGIIYRSDVYAASNISSDGWEQDNDAPRRPGSVHRSGWGGKSVLILIGLRLGLDGVNPIYYDSIKTLFTFPHSVGIAGGRPSSSYYFVASQANSLFYLDPHFTRQAVPLRTPPPKAAKPPGRRTTSDVFSERSSVHFEDEDEEGNTLAPAISRSSDSSSLPTVDVVNLDHDSPELTSSPVSEFRSPSKPRRRLTLTQTLRIMPGSPSSRRGSAPGSPTTPTIKGLGGRRTSHPSPSPSRPPAPTRHSTASSASSLRSSALPVDPQTAWYASAYSEANLKTFHCDKVKKLPLSGLDPSMLIGFLCQTEAEFDDFCERVSKLPQKIFTVQDEPPLWSDDEDGLESVSEPVSDIGSEHGSDDEEADLGFDDMDEFGHVSRPLGVQRDDTITPLSAAAAGLGLDTRGTRGGVAAEEGEDADTEEEADTTARLLARKARRSSAASTSSQRRIKRPEEDDPEILGTDSTTTLSALAPPRVETTSASDVETDAGVEASDAELVQMPIARATRPVDAATPPRPVRPARLGKGKRKPPQEVFTPTDDEAEAAEADMVIPPARNESLSAKASIASLNKAAAIDIPKSSPAGSLGPRQRGTVRNLKAYAAAQAAQAKEDAEPPELLNRSEVEYQHDPEPVGKHSDDELDQDPDMSFEDVAGSLGSTPSSAPVMVERPSPRGL